LHANGANPLTFRIGDRDLPAAAIERVVHKPRAGHRLDRRPHHNRSMAPLDPACEPVQAISVRRDRTHLHALTGIVKQAKVQPPAAQIQTSMQHHKKRPPQVASDG
jgi:hypothetical protein